MAIEENTDGVTLLIMGKNEEQVAQAIEAISRPLTGLILEGMTVVISRSVQDD